MFNIWIIPIILLVIISIILIKIELIPNIKGYFADRRAEKILQNDDFSDIVDDKEEIVETRL